MDTQLIIDHMCRFLTTDELKTVRLVNAHFLDGANREFWKRGHWISFLYGSRNHDQNNQHLDLPDFQTYLSFKKNKYLGCRFRRIALTTSILTHKNLVDDFLDYCADNITHIRIKEDKLSRVEYKFMNISPAIQQYSWKSLVSIEIVANHGCKSFLKSVFMNAPNLKECKVITICPFSHSSLNKFLNSYQFTSVPKLTSLTLKDFFNNNKFCRLKQLGLPLKTLRLFSDAFQETIATELSRLLESCCMSLKKLEIIGDIEETNPGFLLPHMPVLTECSITWKLAMNETIRFSKETFTGQFPVLKELLWNPPAEVIQELLSRGLTKSEKLKRLRIRSTHGFPMHLYEIKECFANLCVLEIDFNNDDLQVVFKSFTLLQELRILNTSRNWEINAVFIGVNFMCSESMIDTEDYETFEKKI